jgi:hypothetical protein
MAVSEPRGNLIDVSNVLSTERDIDMRFSKISPAARSAGASSDSNTNSGRRRRRRRRRRVRRRARNTDT